MLRRTYEHLILKVSVKYFVILLVLAGVIGTAYAESQVIRTPFDIYLLTDDFTAEGPNHNILALDKGESATITVHVKNNDDKPHQIILKDPRGPNLGLFETFRFEPEQITVMPHQTSSTQLYLTISKDTNTHSSFVTFLGQSSIFGMKGLGFFVVVDREIDDYIDKSLRSGLPGGAFPHLNTEISENKAEKLIGSGFGIPEYLPLEYEFRGMDGSEDQQRFVYSPATIDTETTVFSEFWNDGGLLVIYNVDGPNVNNTKSLPIKVAQDEGQQIMINGMMGDATEKQTRVVVESDITYDVPASVSFFDDAKKESVHLRANMSLDELLKIASSIPIYDGMDSTHDESEKSKQYSERLDPDPVLDLWNKHSEIIDGTIISKTTFPGTGKGPTEFHVKVNKFFKPLSKNIESITLFASHADSDIPSDLNEGDRALIYIESGNQISKYSVKVDDSTYCEPRDYIQIGPVLPNDPNQLVRGAPTLPFDWKDQCVADYYTEDPDFWKSREYRPPMQQWKVHNIPIEEQRCSGEGEDYASVQKIGNVNYKYCVKPDSVPKLIERGWIENALDIHIIRYSPVLFEGTGIDLQEDELIEYLENKRDYLDTAIDEVGAKSLYPITGMSLLIGNNAYSLDEKYVGNPIALDIRVLKEKFTKKTLEEIHQLVRQHVGDDIDIVFSKGVYAVPTPMASTSENNSQLGTKYPDFPQIDSLRPDDRLQVRHKAGYTVVEITLSSWDEYHHWEKSRGSGHDDMPPVSINKDSIDPIVLDLLNEMWKFEGYEVSKHDKSLFVKNISKDYDVSNHHGIHDWLKAEHDKVFGESNDGFSSHFEFQDRVYQVTMLAID